jgi:hypothetical protein
LKFLPEIVHRHAFGEVPVPLIRQVGPVIVGKGQEQPLVQQGLVLLG